MSSRTQPIRSPDYIFLTLVLILVCFGFLMLFSASGPSAYNKFNGDSLYFVKHQFLFGLVPGFVGLFVFSRISYHFWKQYAWSFLLISIILLVLVFIPGIGSDFGKGAHSWISIGPFFSLQPSEIAKITFLFYLAAWLEKRGVKGVQDIQSGLVPFISVLGVIMFLMIMQPDTGTMSIIVVMSLIVYFAGGAPIWHILGLGASGVGLLGLLIATSDYRRARLMTLLHPATANPSGAGYHISQALLAIGSGGIFGLGYGHSRQKFQYLPEVVGDSIFAVISEEMGLIVGVLLVLAFVFLFLRALRIAARAPDAFGKYVVIGIGTGFLAQAFINIGSISGILPLTGITLPFISYGGTSLAVSLASVGIVLNISRYGKS